MRITRRLSLILTLGVLQASLLGVAWFSTFSTIRREFAAVIERQVLEDNARTASEFADLIQSQVSGPIEFGSPDWDRVQSMVESLDLSAEGFACLIDEDGKVLCHPQLRNDPGLRDVSLGDLTLTQSDGTAGSVGGIGGDAQGTLSVPFEGTHYVATEPLDDHGARLLVHQPEHGLVRASDRATEHVTRIAVLTLVVTSALFMGALFLVMRRYESRVERINAGLEQEVERRFGQSLATRHGLIIGLAKLADSRDTDTGAHLDRISVYSAMLAEELSKSRRQEIDDHWIECMRLASTLHDIGKVGVPDSVLLKPGKLTPEERTEIEKHTIVGAEALGVIRDRLGEDDLVSMSLDIARSHHERWDGKGYPDGLAGEAIPIAARVVAVADVYDALTSQRVYKAAMPHDEAVRIILDDAGTHFDPVVCEAFARIADNFNVIRAMSHHKPLDPRDPEKIIEPAA